MNELQILSSQCADEIRERIEAMIFLDISRKPVYVSMMFPGLTLPSHEWSQGDKAAFYVFMDAIPRVSPVYQDSGCRVSAEYLKILQADLPKAPPLSDDERRSLAQALLYIRENRTEYGTLQFKLQEAELNYYRMKKLKDKEKEEEYRSQKKELRWQNKDFIKAYEDQRNIVLKLNKENQDTIQYQMAKEVFESSALEEGIYELMTFPRITGGTKELNWNNMKLNLEQQMGITLPGQEAGGRRSVSISFEFCRVKVLRPWLYLDLLSCREARLRRHRKYDISSGAPHSPNPGTMPLIAADLFLARHVSIEGYFTKQEREYYSDGTGKSFGPFLLGESRMQERYKTDKSEIMLTCMTAPSPQIIGVGSLTVPAFPHESG